MIILKYERGRVPNEKVKGEHANDQNLGTIQRANETRSGHNSVADR